jgi:2-polyprenyl-6-methoxyphenol hydroxylase-like FAD-dependent oxidoreductase
MLACELRLAGSGVVLLEQAPELSARSPGTAINPAVIELLEMRGLMNACRTDGFEFPLAHFAHIWLHPDQLADRHPYNFALPHSRLTRHLAERARSLGADLRFGYRFTGLAQDQDAIGVRTAGPGGERVLECRYLVGCDGADSTVRAAAGIAFPGDETPFHGVVADLAVEPGNALNQHFGADVYSAGLCTLTPAGAGLVRVLTGAFGTEPPSRDSQPTLDEVRASVRDIAGIEFTDGELVWSARWFNATRLAANYRAGRVFVAGDAAHVHFPLGGQALSTGIEDAVNLGWKIGAEVAGWAPTDLLDSYHAERHPVGARACRTTRAQLALLHPLTDLREIIAELVRFPAVNEYLVEMVGGTDVRYPMKHSPDTAGPLLGRRLPAVPVIAEREPELASAWASGATVLLDLRDDAGSRFDVGGWADRIRVVRTKPLPGVEAEALLIRPDGRIAWVTGTGGNEGLPEALRTWMGSEESTNRARQSRP